MHFSKASGRLTLAVVIGAVAFQSVTSVCLADGKRDYYIQEAERLFFDTTTNARQAGQAGASNLTSTDSSAVVNNPAGLGMNHGGDLSGSYINDEISGNQQSDYAEVKDEADLGQVLLSFPLNPTSDGTPNAGAFGLGWTGGNSDSDDSVGTDTDVLQVHGSYGIEIEDGISVGYGLSYFDNEQKTAFSNFEENSGFRHNFGTQYTDGDLTTGATFFFASGDYDLAGLNGDGSVATGNSDYAEHGFELAATSKVDDATSVSFGGGYRDFDVDGDFVAGAPDTFVGGNEGGSGFNVKLGLEHWVNEWLAARAGYRFEGRTNYFFGREDLRDFNGSAKTNVWAMGLGVSLPTGMHYFPKVNVDYAAEYREIAYGDWQQWVTLSFPFTLCEPM